MSKSISKVNVKGYLKNPNIRYTLMDMITERCDRVNISTDICEKKMIVKSLNILNSMLDHVEAIR